MIEALSSSGDGQRLIKKSHLKLKRNTNVDFTSSLSRVLAALNVLHQFMSTTANSLSNHISCWSNAAH